MLNLQELSEEFAVSPRTLQRDFNERLNFLEFDETVPANFYRLKSGYYTALTPVEIERFARFASIQNLFPKIDRTFYQEKLTESILVKGIKYENISLDWKSSRRITNWYCNLGYVFICKTRSRTK